jgi:hypothetical protein
MNGMRPYPDAYVKYLAVYHGARDFFECHEIMEEYWKNQTGARHEKCWLALIRLAVACYHARRGNWPGARKMMGKALQEVNPQLMDELGLDGRRLARMMRETQDRWANEIDTVYEDIDLPVTDPALLQEAMRVCQECGWTWGMPSRKAHPDVIHRHLTRDRTEVIEARHQAARRKRRAKASDSSGASDTVP